MASNVLSTPTHYTVETDTLVYFAVLDNTGQMVAGVRGIGPLQSADDSHAVIEWAGQPSQQAVRNMINDRVPFGVVEMKSAWVIDEGDQDRCLTAALARTAGHVTALLDVQFCMATAAAYVLNRWRSSGCVVASIPAAPYPNERYQTKMMWFDRRDFVNHATESQQVAKMRTETTYLPKSTTASGGPSSLSTEPSMMPLPRRISNVCEIHWYDGPGEQRLHCGAIHRTRQ